MSLITFSLSSDSKHSSSWSGTSSSSCSSTSICVESPIGKGNQGCVTAVTLPNGTFAVKKVSTYVDYTIELESDALQRVSLLELPHFCKYVDLYDDAGVQQSTMVMCKIDGPIMRRFVRDTSVANQAKLNALYQTLSAVQFMNSRLNISHNDLHYDNVMIEKTDVDVNVYQFSNGSKYAVKTYGYNPVIIDFGFAHLPHAPLRSPWYATCEGYFPFEMDNIWDAKRLLETSITVFPDAKTIPNVLLDVVEDLQNSCGYKYFSVMDKVRQYVCTWNCDDKASIFNPEYVVCFKDMIALVLANVKHPLKMITTKRIKDMTHHDDYALIRPSKIVFTNYKHDEQFHFKVTADPGIRKLTQHAFLTLAYWWSKTLNCLADDLTAKQKTNQIGLSFLRSRQGKQCQPSMTMSDITGSLPNQLKFFKDVLRFSQDELMDKYADLKRTKRDATPHIVRLKNAATLFTFCVNNLVVKFAKRLSTKKRLNREQCMIRNTMDVLDVLPKEKVEFESEMKVAVYDEQTLVHSTQVLTKETAKIFNKTYC